MPSYPSKQFALFRIIFGVYLFQYFYKLYPYVGEIYSNTGMYARDTLPKAFPSILHMWGSPFALEVFVVVLIGLSVAFAMGCYRRITAFLLWYGWSCMMSQIPFVVVPSDGYVGWMLLACAIIPSGEAWSVHRADRFWEFPKHLYYVTWVAFMLGYTLSGVEKLGTVSWVNGDAMRLILESPVARPGAFLELLRAWPEWFWIMVTWVSLVGELSSIGFCFTFKTRLYIWLFYSVMHVLIILMFNLTDVASAMFLTQLLLFDVRWLRESRVFSWVPKMV